MKLQTNSFDRGQIESVRLGREDVLQQCALLWRLPLHQRKLITGLPPNRADVILMGAAILAAAMEEFGLPEVRVSTRGLRFAAVMEQLSAAASEARAGSSARF
jgi:exopolyphosphatase/guanosine-5'-triphosphate,3'-diphosphate pyrophosphatase